MEAGTSFSRHRMKSFAPSPTRTGFIVQVVHALICQVKCVCRNKHYKTKNSCFDEMRETSRVRTFVVVCINNEQIKLDVKPSHLNVLFMYISKMVQTS